jgi:8-oxo-dGTP pyrophosphatase MutT (NUDIX family)
MLNTLKGLAIYFGTKYLLKPFKKPVPSKPASTLLFVRDGARGLEVFMVERHHQIDFASGALVFPGGKVNQEDKAHEIRAFCDGVDGFDDYTLGMQVAAIREGFEECGLLLARMEGNPTLLNAGQLKKLDQYRTQIHKKKISLLEFLEKENLRLACDRLQLFSHWITPEFLPKRFDTFFYLAQAPEDQVGLHDGYESVDSFWISAKEALNDAKTGKRTVIFPTRVNLYQLGKHKTVQEAVTNVTSDPSYPVCPTLCRKGAKVLLTIPEEAGYGKIAEPLIEM